MLTTITLLQNSQNWQERRRAARILRRKTSAEAVAALMNAVDDLDDEVAQVAIISLVQASYADVVQRIIKPRFLISGNSTLRWSVAHALSRFGNRTHFEFLLRMSEDADWTVRDEVFTAFDRILSSLVTELATPTVETIEADIHLLIRMLQIRQKSIRQKIYSILVLAMRNMPLDIMYQALGSENVLVETGVLNVLGMLGKRDTIPQLAQLASSKSTRIRLEVVKNVCLLGGSEAINVLITRLGDGEQRVVAASIEALSTLRGDPHFADILIDRLQHVQNTAIRKNILKVMGHIGDPRFIPFLFDHIGSPFYFIRQAATAALARYKEQVYDRVVDILNPESVSIVPFIKICKESQRIQTRLQAIDLIGHSRDPHAVKFLKTLFADPSTEIVDAAELAQAAIFKSNWERANCAHILGEIGKADSVPSLLRVLGDWSIEVRSEAIGALRKLRTVENPKQIIAALSTEKDPQNRSELIACLGDIGQVNAVTKPAIIAGLEDKSQLVRQHSARMLRLLGPENDVVKLLIRHLADEAIDVRSACLNSLFTLGDSVVEEVRKAFIESDKLFIRFHCISLLGLFVDKHLEKEIAAVAEQDESSFLAQRAKTTLRVLAINRDQDREILFTEHQKQ